MSEAALNTEIQSLAEAERAALDAINSQPSDQTAVKLSIDPLVLFQQVEQLRKDGVDEDTIRKAFSDFMAQAGGNQRRAANSMKRHRDSVPMPTQAEINELYAERYKGVVDEVTDPKVLVILEAMENANKAKLKPLKAPLKQRIAYYIARQFLAASIFVCRLLGVK